MPKWIKDRIGVLLLGLLIFSLILTVTGFVASFEAQRKTAAFASDSRSVSGVVSNKYILDLSQERTYWIYVHSVHRTQSNMFDVSFQTEDGRFHSGSTEVTDAVYELAQVGDPIKVTYVRSRPDWFYVADDAPTDQDATVFVAMFRYAGVASLLILILLGMFVFWAPVTGASADETATGGFLFRSPRPQPRTGFGRRSGL